MMDYRTRDNIYKRAERRVEKIKRFYQHLLVYIVVNIGFTSFKIYRNMQNGETFFDALFDFGSIVIWLAWGIGLALHAFSVFGIEKILGENWEENKIEEYMEEEFKNMER